MLPEPRQAARAKLGLADTDIVVCSFGLLGATKCNHRTLAAWLASPLAADPRCRLVFVGQGKGPYGTEMQQAIAASERAQRITITGWVDTERYRTWLSVADVAVQLRTMTRNFQSELPVHRQRILANMTNNLVKAIAGLPHPEDGIIINNNTSITYLPREDVDFHLD